jgi:twinfilin-like protein
MLYSSGVSGVFHAAKAVLKDTTSVLADRRVETSDPRELSEAYLREILGLEKAKIGNVIGLDVPGQFEDKKPFARPKGPGRRR